MPGPSEFVFGSLKLQIVRDSSTMDIDMYGRGPSRLGVEDIIGIFQIHDPISKNDINELYNACTTSTPIILKFELESKSSQYKLPEGICLEESDLEWCKEFGVGCLKETTDTKRLVITNALIMHISHNTVQFKVNDMRDITQL